MATPAKEMDRGWAQGEGKGRQRKEGREVISPVSLLLLLQCTAFGSVNLRHWPSSNNVQSKEQRKNTPMMQNNKVDIG